MLSEEISGRIVGLSERLGKLEGSLKEIQTHGNQIGFEKQQLEDNNDAIEIKKSIDF